MSVGIKQPSCLYTYCSPIGETLTTSLLHNPLPHNPNQAASLLLHARSVASVKGMQRYDENGRQIALQPRTWKQGRKPIHRSESQGCSDALATQMELARHQFPIVHNIDCLQFGTGTGAHKMRSRIKQGPCTSSFRQARDCE